MGIPIAIGVDLCDIRRIEKLYRQFGEKFLCRVLTAFEREKFSKKPVKAAMGYLAKRWAAKEACSKALGTGFASGVRPKHIEIRNYDSGQPYVVLYGAALERLRHLTKKNNMSEILISMTDEIPYAFCEIEIISKAKTYS